MTDIIQNVLLFILALGLVGTIGRLRNLSKEQIDLESKFKGLEFRQLVEETYDLEPVQQLEQLKALIDNRLEELNNGRNQRRQ